MAGSMQSPVDMGDQPLLDNSDLTLDLIHILELLDRPTNYGKILNVVGEG